jgi:hypothetical protein
MSAVHDSEPSSEFEPLFQNVTRARPLGRLRSGGA